MDYDAILQKLKNINAQNLGSKEKLIQLLCSGYSLEEIKIKYNIKDYQEYLPSSILSKHIEFLINSIMKCDNVSQTNREMENIYGIKISRQSLHHYLSTINLDSKNKYISASDVAWKIFFNYHKNEINFHDIKPTDIFKNKEIGAKIESIKEKYYRSEKYQDTVRKFWDCLPNEFFSMDIKSKMELEKEEIIKYLAENKDLNFKSINSWENKIIGRRVENIKRKFLLATPEEQKQIRESWSCLPDEFWYRQRKEKKEDEEWKKLFVEYNKEFGFKTLNQKTIHNDESLGSKFNRIKTEYNKSTPEQQKAMREFWDCFPIEFWDNQRKVSEYKTDEEWKELFIQYNKEFGIENLKHTTKYNNENIGYAYGSIKTEYNKSTPEQQKQIREYWECLPESMWERKISIPKSDEEWKELFVQYDKEFGIENLDTNTIYKNENIGNKLITIKKKYNKSIPEQQKEMREFWDCLPVGFWDSQRKERKENEKWKNLFVQYDKEIGIKNLNTRTIYKNKNLGNKFNEIKKKYNKSIPEQQKEMREFWDCLPVGFWDSQRKERKENEKWKNLFVQYDKEIGIENLKRNTKHKNENLGSSFTRIKEKYNKSTPEQQKAMREFWDCFPSNMWERKASEYKNDKEWKKLFVQYDKEIGIKNLKNRTVFNNENLGSKFNGIKTEYNKSTPEQQKAMREFWDCFSLILLKTTPSLKTS